MKGNFAEEKSVAFSEISGWDNFGSHHKLMTMMMILQRGRMLHPESCRSPYMLQRIACLPPPWLNNKPTRSRCEVEPASYFLYSWILMTGTGRFSKMSVSFHQTTWGYIPEVSRQSSHSPVWEIQIQSQRSFRHSTQCILLRYNIAQKCDLVSNYPPLL